LHVKQASGICRKVKETGLRQRQGLINQTALEVCKPFNPGISMRLHLKQMARIAIGQTARTLLVLLLLPLAAAQAQGKFQQTASAIRFTGDAKAMRLEIDFDQPPEATANLLAAPYRLVIDMPETLFALDAGKAPAAGLIKSYRFGLMQAGRSRMVFALASPFSASSPQISPSPDGKRQTLSIDLKPATAAEFDAALSAQTVTTSSVSSGKGDRVGQPKSGKLFTIVIDPGHGGIDGGATGIHGATEKSVTLAFSRELRERLARLPGVSVFLTREDDRFIALDERVRIARQLNASLFISVHTDTIRDNSMRGATVYTLSEKASDDVAHAVALQENLSDAIGGVESAVEDQNVADILIDLTRRETMQFSVKFARALVESIQKRAKTINHPHRSAGFKVLKAPDVPSVLVELGYLSNPEDEKLVSDPAWRQGVLEEMSKAIGTYASEQMSVRQ
jgi:N-acetylmuramoyl-L-alanine amidase